MRVCSTRAKSYQVKAKVLWDDECKAALSSGSTNDKK